MRPILEVVTHFVKLVPVATQVPREPVFLKGQKVSNLLLCLMKTFKKKVGSGKNESSFSIKRKGKKRYRNWESQSERVQSLSCVQLFATPWTVAPQAPLSVEFSRQESWNGLPFPSPEDLPDPGIEPRSLASPVLAGGFFTASTTWKTRGSLTSTDLSSVSLSTVWNSVYFPFPHRNNYCSILYCKEIQPVHSKGDQSWVFFGRNDAKAETPVLWPPHAELTHWKRL